MKYTIDFIQYHLKAEGLNQVDENGFTPLTYAASHEQGYKVIQELISKGANVNLVDGNGRTPLTSAAHHSRVQNTHILVKCGANTLLLDGSGKSPSQAAHSSNARQIGGFLASLGSGANQSNNDANDLTKQGTNSRKPS